MKKTAEQEVQIKLAVQDLIVRNPLISGHQPVPGLWPNRSLRSRIKREDGARSLTSSPLDVGRGRWVGHAQQQAH